MPEVRSNQEIGLSSQVLLFAFAIIIAEGVIIKLVNMDSASAVRLLTVTLILVSTLYLTTAGYNSPQIATSTGLLGTIAGYLLGRTNEGSSNSTK